IGAATALAVALLGPSGEPPGARLATRIGTIISITGSALSLLGGVLLVVIAAPLGKPFYSGTIAALTAGGIGVTLVVAMVSSVIPAEGGRGTSAPSAGVSLRSMIAGATAMLTIATWALASAYVTGHLQAASRQTAVDEAR